jgi:hypothetical protein
MTPLFSPAAQTPTPSSKSENFQGRRVLQEILGTCACQPCAGAAACEPGSYYTAGVDRCLDLESVMDTEPYTCCQYCPAGSQTEDGSGAYAFRLARTPHFTSPPPTPHETVPPPPDAH